MSTMLSGAAVMDGALLLIASNESCPQPQTSEHLAAIEIMKMNNIVVVQNKVDLLKEDVAAEYEPYTVFGSRNVLIIGQTLSIDTEVPKRVRICIQLFPQS